MHLTYYTDGGCHPNPGRGVWAFHCLETGLRVAGHDHQTTNNRMELMAVIQAFEQSQRAGAISLSIYTDSMYVARGFNEWMYGWERCGWVKVSDAGSIPVKNTDLWKRIYVMADKAKISWVKGHSGNIHNELADELCGMEYQTVFGEKMPAVGKYYRHKS